ncbi:MULTISPECIES: GGDEF domain-containing protein [Aurantimonas]|uniref:GGDEF domain-containing protein n=1 Tax=Aurantimonas TaxID=182269 RepID=UPI001FCCEFAB|nr:GGDEF domain-containing protein [Aurantimonas coralicida]
MAVSLHAVIFGVVASLALLCGLIYLGLRGQSALVWLAAGLACGAVETVVLGIDGGSLAAMAAVTMLIPAAYLCVTQSVRRALGLGLSPRPLWMATAGLTAMSLLLLAGNATPILQTLPFQFAALLALGDAILCLWRLKGRGVVETGLLVALAGMAVLLIVRMPLFPLLFEGTTPVANIAQSDLERALMLVSGLLAPAAVLLIIARIVGNVIRRYRIRSERDDLTDLLNRAAFERVATQAAPAGAAIIVCDIDHFKTVNDRYGHPVGDRVIQGFAEILSRTEGTAGRLGGEEFALLLPGATLDAAASAAEAIRLAFHAWRDPALDDGHALSASFGVAMLQGAEPAQDAIARADDALYRAKREGRNRVSVHAAAAKPARLVAAA